MKSAAMILAALTAGTASASTWQTTLTPAKAGEFGMLRGLKAKYRFGWAAVTAGYAETEFSTKNGVCRLRATGGSSGLARTMWKMDADATSTVFPATLETEKLVQVETYADEKRTTTAIFTPEGVSRSRVRVPEDKDVGKVKRFKFAPVRDLHGALLFVRSQPLKQNDILRFVVYPNAAAYLAEIQVLGREKIKVAGREWPTIKIALRLEEIRKDLELAPHKKFKSATGWFSDDKDRLLLKVETDVMVGKVWMELQQVTFADAK